MKRTEGDRDLHEAFAILRREDSMRDPGFRGVLERRRRDGAPRILAPALALTGVVACLGALVAYQQTVPTTPRDSAPATLEAWSEPTAFLLRTPGHDLLTTMPAIIPAALPQRVPRSNRPNT